MSCFNANAVGKPCDRTADDDDSDQKPASKPQTRKRSYSDAPSFQEMGYRVHRQTFPEKLYLILMKPEYNHIISFISGGKAWKVHNRAKFESEVMEKHFDSTRWESFLRQVTGWGFRRVNRKTASSVSEHGSYWHKYFVLGQPALVSSIRRIATGKGNAGSKEMSANRLYSNASSVYCMQPSKTSLDTNHNHVAIPAQSTILDKDTEQSHIALSAIPMNTGIPFANGFNTMPATSMVMQMNHQLPFDRNNQLSSLYTGRNVNCYVDYLLASRNVPSQKTASVMVDTDTGSSHGQSNILYRAVPGSLIQNANYSGGGYCVQDSIPNTLTNVNLLQVGNIVNSRDSSANHVAYDNTRQISNDGNYCI